MIPREGVPMRYPRLVLTLALSVNVALVLLASDIASPRIAEGAAFVVNSTSDGTDSNFGDGLCDDGTGSCTLRAAILEADVSAGADIISFSIGTGAQTINVGSSGLGALPTIIGSVTIDGTTQPGFTGAPLIE